MAEEIEEYEAPEDDLEARFDAVIAGETPEAVEEEVEEEVIEEPEEEEIIPDPPRIDGPTPAMETVARQAGIPPKLVALARDDKQLQEMIGLTEEQQEQPVPEAEVPKFDITLPEDEYGSDNATREQFIKMRDHYEGILSGFRDDMSSIVGAVKGMHEEQTESVKRREANVQRGFDTALDSLDSDTFGKTGDTMSETNKGVRSVAFGPYQRLKNENPSLSDLDAMKMAVKETFPEMTDNNKAKQQRQSLQKQSRQRLGSGQSKPAPESGPDRDERFEDFLSKLGK